jgi:hypothetical protein
VLLEPALRLSANETGRCGPEGVQHFVEGLGMPGDCAVRRIGSTAGIGRRLG